MPDARGKISARIVAGSLLAALLVAPPAREATAANVDHKPWGRLRAPDQALEKGCHKYFFRYRVDPPRDEWLAEMFVRSPEGVHIHHTVKDSEFHKNRGRVRFTICKISTSYGRHKLRMRISWYEDDPASTQHTGWVKPRYFRMTRP
ncbi:MAG TPA: hypothetical protein VD859_16460 [Nocardioides sp.]|nr:hypothetical protein [Nocardioides sp.]